MIAQGRVVPRTAIAAVLVALCVPTANAESWGPREDVGVAVVDTRTGKVLWEVWRLDEVPAGTTKEEKTAIEYLLGLTRDSRKVLPQVTTLPDFPTKDLDFKNPWAERWPRGETASEGKSLIYFRHGIGVVALDRQTKKEVWRLETTRAPYRSAVLEVGENRAFIQIGSDVPATLSAVLVTDPRLPMENLQPHTTKQRVAAATFLHHFGDGYLRPELRKIVEQLREDKNDPDAGPAAKAIEKLLTNWPQKRDHQKVLSGSVATLLKADEGDPFREFAWPGAQRVLAWSLLQEQIFGSPCDAYSRQGYNYAYDGWDEQPVSLTDTTKAKLVEQCWKVFAEGPDKEKPFAVSILVSSTVGWSRLTDAERKNLFLSSEPSGWRWAALALVRENRREQLMEWAKERPAGDLLDVIWVLRHNEPEKPKELTGAELELWLNCARATPGGLASVLERRGGPHLIAFRKPIREYLERQIAKPTAKDDVYAALLVLASWNNPDDTSLLLEYLKHPAEQRVLVSDDKGRRELRLYPIRSLAQGLLTKRGAKIPPDIVYEEVIPPTRK